jgi:YNFM family putative membrane transporter
MKYSSVFVILFTTVVVFCVLYMPQPILPLLALEFGVSRTEAALITAVVMVPLGIAPIFYGYVADYASAKRLLRVTVGLLALSEGALAFAGDFRLMLALRFVQGLLLPATFTSLITYSANTATAARVRNAVNYYIGASILGGFTGRFLGGFISEHVDWHWAFLLIAGLLALAWLLLGTLGSDERPKMDVIALGAVRAVFSQPLYRYSYFAIFSIFFVFSSVLNFIPFRLTALNPAISESTISLVYVGYLSGALIALNGVRIARWLGGELRGVSAGLALLPGGLSGLLLPSVAGIFVSLFVTCTAFFLVHSLLSAFLNHHATGAKGVVNGLYISFYYSGGALGAWLPGYLYRAGGWHSYLAALCALVGLSALWVWKMHQAAAQMALPRPA